MSSHKCQESEVMVRQVNLVAAFHDHISCTKISQQTIGSNICGLQSVGDMSQSQTQTHESDHMYATDNKCANHSIINNNNNNNNNNNENTTNSNSNSNGIINNNLFVNNLSDERNQIQKLTEMILAQLDLIQHQQEQLLKKDRQLQGLKQDREALCLRLEKMEKRIAVLTTKVANNQINNNLNLTRNIANSNNSSNTTETDCDQSGSDTIIEDNNSVIGLFTDPTVFAKLYSQSSGVTTININNLNNNNNSSNTNMNNTITNTSTNTCNSITTVRIKSEPQNTIDSEENMATITTTNTTMTSTASARKNRKRHPEVIPPSSTSTIPSNKKRGKGLNVSTNIDINNVDIKKEPLSSSDSLRTSQTIKTYSNKKKANKLKSETSANTLNFKTTSLTKDILTTTKPYSITVNRIHSPLDLCVVNSCSNTDINNTNTFNNNNNSSVEEKNMSSTISDIIQVPNWKLHPVSSCYSLEGTEVLLLLFFIQNFRFNLVFLFRI
jgi:hypothetical protein